MASSVTATKEVAGLLVKTEETDVAQMQAKAEELLRQYGVAPKPAPCQAESQACAQCFREHPKEAWRCQQAAEAYRMCSTAAFSAARG
ncbi:hypothetical protein GPECTOR_89g488 [Gonium pectorale]|uniref:Uncharacterized protein n=1 Tax=Gonium pectorale TaxID=33097 RepID=A0A150G0V6_GONPE|nr:hypothetical protein GPECTOR_89g488 [Gonium pectorale]|eukprot:KXZ43468.1 hypothetical protein GPECTOR_89g488 [Gonium pectorale]